MADTQTIPILLHCDVEPDERMVDPNLQCDWIGFERLVESVPLLRTRLEAATDRPAHLSWFVRMDPQVSHVYGSAGWAVARYGSFFENLAASGDQIGLHVHTWQWQNNGNYWSQNFADEAWVSHCVDSSLSAFEQSFGRPSEVHRFGDHWMNAATMDLLERRGIVCDLTVEPGLPNGTAPDPYTGTFPDYSNVPRLPYRRSPESSLRIIPVSTGTSEWLTTPRAERSDDVPDPPPHYTPHYEGWFDAATTDAIDGWVWDCNHPERRLDVDVFCDDELLATVGATGYRADLEAAGKGDGSHAFHLGTPKRLIDGRQHQVRVKVCGTDIDLFGAPRDLVGGACHGVVTLLLDIAPMVFAPMVDRLLASLSSPYLNVPMRSDAGADPLRRTNIVRNIDHLLSHPLSARFAFLTPNEFVDSWPGLASGSSSQSLPASSVAT